MNISIFGLGYVGSVSAACLANKGHHVIGVEVDKKKVDIINKGKTLIIEPLLKDITEKSVNSGNLSATLNAAEAIAETDVSFICVGTPCQSNNKIDMRYVEDACKTIGAALKKKNKFHVLVFRSTMFPGSLKNIIIPTLEKFSDKKAGDDFSVCINPGFLKEGSAVHDFYYPSQNIVGATDDLGRSYIHEINASFTDVKTINMDMETVEMIKYSYNIWHALKVCFANEIGNVCKKLNIDSHEVMNVFCEDKKLNMSEYYLKPGFAFGGSCLPKDLRVFLYESKNMDLDLPVLNAILPSNKLQIEQALNIITSQNKRKIGVLGISFKSDTDDLRESPMVELIERLLGKGFQVKVYDKNVLEAKKDGINHDYLENHISHISTLLYDDIHNVLNDSDIIVIGNKAKEFEKFIDNMDDEKVWIDLVRIGDKSKRRSNYQGICW